MVRFKVIKDWLGDWNEEEMDDGMLFIATATWGCAFIEGKIAVQSFEPATVAFLRFLGAAVLLFPIMWIIEKNRKKLTLKDYVPVDFKER
jgi:drug/metabolite transporter (DMT)-like permease